MKFLELGSHPLLTGLVKNWLEIDRPGQQATPIQVIETDSIDAYAAAVSRQVELAGCEPLCFDFSSAPLADPLALFQRIFQHYQHTFGEHQLQQLFDRYCYPLHKPLFDAWLNDRFYYREETLIYEEAKYERHEFFLSLDALLDAIAAARGFSVLIKDIQNAPEIVLSYLSHRLNQHSTSSQWTLMGFVSVGQGGITPLNRKAWQSMMRLLERHGLLMPLASIEAEHFSWPQIPRCSSFDDHYRYLLRAADLFAYADVIAQVAAIRRRFSHEQNAMLLFISAFSSLMQDDLETAVRDFAKVQNRLQLSGETDVLISSYFWQSIGYAMQSQTRLAWAAQEQCEKMALFLEDRRWYVLSLYAGFVCDAHNAQHRLTPGSIRSLSHLLSELNYANIQALLLTQVYSYNEQAGNAISVRYMKNCRLAMRLARGNKNRLCMSFVLHAMGAIHMRNGNLPQTQRLYEMSLRLREECRQHKAMIALYNGLGYFYIGQEEWRKAWSMFDRSLSMLVHNRNFYEVSVTFYNLAWLYYQSGHIAQSLDVLNDLLELMQIREVEHVPFHNLADLYTLKGWLHIQLRQPAQAGYCLMRVRALSHLTQDSLSQVLQELLKARIAMSEQLDDQAAQLTAAAENLCQQATSLDMHQRNILLLEIASNYQLIGLAQKAAPLSGALRQIAQSHNLATLAQRVSRASLGLSNYLETHVPKIQQPYKVFLDMARKDRELRQMQQQLSDVQQTRVMLDLSANEPNLDRYLMQVLNTLNRRIPAASFALLIDPHEQMPVHQLRPQVNVDSERLQHWCQQLQHATKPQNFVDSYGHVSAWPLTMVSSGFGWLVVAGNAHQSRLWNDEFLQVASQQLGLILDRRLCEAQLKCHAPVDQVAGTVSYAELQARLQHRLRQQSQPLTLCCFGIDHFQQFIAEHGRDRSDQVLSHLVKFVLQSVEGEQTLCRIGGDEFILLLQPKSVEMAYAEIAAIQQQLVASEDWQQIMHRVNDSKAKSDPQLISLSCGLLHVNHWPITDLDVADLLAQAERCLASAKSAGKNSIYQGHYQPANG